MNRGERASGKASVDDMAQTSRVREQDSQAALTARGARDGTSATPPAAPLTRPGFLSRLVPSRVDRPTDGAGGKPASKPRTGTSKLLFGMLILLVVSQGLEYGLAFAEQRFHLGLFTPVTTDHSVFLIGGLRWFEVIYFGLIILLYIALLRFNIIPRDPFNNRARLAANRAGSDSNLQRPAGSAMARTRAARRASGTAPVTPPTARPPVRRFGVKPRAEAPPVPTATKPVRASGQHDSIYEQVKMAQRQQRRRASKR